MRRMLGFCAVLAIANLTLLVGMASAYQTPATGRTAPPPPAASPATNAVNNALQGTTAPDTVGNPTQTPAVPGAAAPAAASPATNAVNNALQGTTAPGTVGNPTQTPAVPGAATNVVPGATTGTSAAYGGAYAPATQPGTTTGTSAAYGGAYATGTQPGTTTMAPGTVAPGSPYTQAVPNRAYSSYYVPGAQPARTPVTPMAEIPYYNSYYGAGRVQPGTVNSGYYTYPAGTSGYSSMYVTPGSGYGYGTASPTYRPARRGLFGGLFGRRNRQVYSVGPSGTTYGTSPYGSTAGTMPYGTTYGAAPYSSGYVSTPGSYTYGAAPY